MCEASGAVKQLLYDGTGRRPRADARRNVERLVAAARTAIAEVGIDVGAHEIARRAGVGVGTFYRRVPSREALLEAVLDEVLVEMLDSADAGLSDDEPWRGFHTFASTYVRLRAESCGIGEALGNVISDALEEKVIELRTRMRRLTERAQEAGALRADVAWQDVPFLLAAASTDEHSLGIRAGDAQWQRNLQVILDGLSTTRPTPLPAGPPE